jgi:hypothetical protein
LTILAKAQEHVLPCRALQPFDHVDEGRPVGQERLLDQDGQTEVDGQHHKAQGTGVFGDEVLDRRQHAVAWSPFVLGVGQLGIQAPTPVDQV